MKNDMYYRVRDHDTIWATFRYSIDARNYVKEHPFLVAEYYSDTYKKWLPPTLDKEKS